MKEIAIQVVSTTVNDPRIAHGVAVATSGTGMATFLEYIPTDIGKLATLLGMILTVILIGNHVLGFKSRMIGNRQKEIELEEAEIHLAKLKKEVDR